MALKIPASILGGGSASSYDDTEVRADILTLSTAISNLTNTIDGRIEAKVKAEALVDNSQPGE